MSLVVVRKNEKGVVFVADTALNQPNDENKPSMLQPQLKITFPFPNVCLAFAGLVDFAARASEQVLELDSFDLEKVLNILVAQNIASNNQTDFILATSPDNAIYEIKDRKSLEVDSSWIGDHQAFSKFQQLFHEFSSNPHLSLRLSDSMKGVIDDPSFKTVDGLTVRADNADEDRKFRYQVSVEMYGGLAEIIVEANMPINFGGASTGAHKIDIFPCQGLGGCTLGFYYEIGEFGFVWVTPGRLDTPVKITNVTRAEFVHEVQQRHNIEPAVGLIWDHYFRAAIKLFTASDFTAAEFYCNQGIAMQSTREYLPDADKYFQIFSLKAEALSRQNRHIEAIEAMNEAILRAPGNKMLYWYLGFLQCNISDFSGALISLTNALHIDPNYADAYWSRGNIKKILNIDDLGVADFQKFAELTAIQA